MLHHLLKANSTSAAKGALISQHLAHTARVLDSCQTRSYAKKDNREKKVSFKKQQQMRKELLAKQKREAAERKLELEERKRLEKEAKELARTQAKQDKGQTVGYDRMKPKIVSYATQIGKPSKFLPAETIEVNPGAEHVAVGKWIHHNARVQNIGEATAPLFGLSIAGKQAPNSYEGYTAFHSWITEAVNITYPTAFDAFNASPSSQSAQNLFNIKNEISNALEVFANLHPDASISSYAQSLLKTWKVTTNSLISNNSFVNTLKSVAGQVPSGPTQTHIAAFLSRASKLALDSEDSTSQHDDLESAINSLRSYLNEYTKLRVAKPQKRLFEVSTKKALADGEMNIEVDNIDIRKKVPGIEVNPTEAVSRYSAMLDNILDPTERNSDTLKAIFTNVSNDGQRLLLWKQIRSALLEGVEKEMAEKSTSEDTGKETAKGKRGKDRDAGLKRDNRFVQLNSVFNELLATTSKISKKSGNSFYDIKKPVADLDVVNWLTNLRLNIIPLVQREQELWTPLKRHRLINNPLVRKSVFSFQSKFERGNPDPKKNWDTILNAEVLANPDGATGSIPELSIQGWDVSHYRKLYADIYAAKYRNSDLETFTGLGAVLNACAKVIAQDIFGAKDYKFVECDASETWAPKFVKKVVFSTGNGPDKVLYLDLSPAKMYNFDRHNSIMYPASANTAVLRLPYLVSEGSSQELPFGITRTFSVLEMKKFCGQFMNACLHLFSNEFNGDKLWRAVAKETAENLVLEPSFLSTLEHESKGMKIPEPYVNEITRRAGLIDPKYGAHEILNQVIYSLFDYQVFSGTSGNAPPMEVFRTLEQKLSVNDNVQIFDLGYFWNMHQESPITSLLVKSRAQEVGTANLKTLVHSGKSGIEAAGEKGVSVDALVARVGKEISQK